MSSGRELLNLTPHAIRLLGDTPDEPVLVLPSAGVARAARRTTGRDALVVDGHVVACYDLSVEGVEGLPRTEEGVSLVVSFATALAAGGRGDLLVVAHHVRDAAGAVVGARGLARVVGESATG